MCCVQAAAAVLQEVRELYIELCSDETPMVPTAASCSLRVIFTLRVSRFVVPSLPTLVNSPRLLRSLSFSQS